MDRSPLANQSELIKNAPGTVISNLLANGWKAMPPPKCMAGHHCFRKGNSRAVIDYVCINKEMFSYAYLATPALDFFKERHWKIGALVAADDKFPATPLADLKAALLRPAPGLTIDGQTIALKSAPAAPSEGAD